MNTNVKSQKTAEWQDDDSNCLKIPVIVGISGHIDILTPEAEIEKQMHIFWHALQNLVGPETPIILLSSIAPGADHLAVKYRPETVKYCAVLPFDETAYRNTFSGRSLKEYDDDLHGAYKIIRCHASAGDYAPASEYIRKHSDIILTLWDGYESLNPETRAAEPGGTYYQICSASGMDELLLPHQEKVHLIVNLPVERSRKGPEYHKDRNEKNCVIFPMDSTSRFRSFGGTLKQMICFIFLFRSLRTVSITIFTW